MSNYLVVLGVYEASILVASYNAELEIFLRKKNALEHARKRERMTLNEFLSQRVLSRCLSRSFSFPVPTTPGATRWPPAFPMKKLAPCPAVSGNRNAELEVFLRKKNALERGQTPNENQR